MKQSIKSVKGKLHQQKYTFELFGYDFILDDQMNNYLIETNTNPCLEESNELLKRLLPRMIDDLLAVVSDPIHNSLFSQETYTSNFPLGLNVFAKGHRGYLNNFNLWEQICTYNE